MSSTSSSSSSSSSSSLFDLLTADMTLGVVQFLNVIDSGRLARTCQRQYYLVHQYRQQRGAELVAVANTDLVNEPVVIDGPRAAPALVHRNTTMPDCVNMKSVRSLQTKPNLVLAFCANRLATRESYQTLKRTYAPNPNVQKTVILGTSAAAIQVNNTQRVDGVPNIEHESLLSVMTANLPQAEIIPFCVHEMPSTNMRLLEWHIQNKDPSYWKSMIVYASGQGTQFVEQFVRRMQQLLPKASIVGGISEDGYVSKPLNTRGFLMSLPEEELREWSECTDGQAGRQEMVDATMNRTNYQPVKFVLNGIYGVVLGGEAPVRSMVSRGVKSVFQGKPQPFSSFVVHETRTVQPADEHYMFRTDGDESLLHPYHLISQIKDTDLDEIMTVPTFLAKPELRETELMGIKREGRDGFELESVSPYSSQLGAFLIHTDGTDLQTETLKNAQLDFYFLDGDACKEDMDETVAKLKEQTKGEQILGAVMFSCNGRGPESGYLIDEEMADAKRFAQGFPNVPCLGFYAGGEIGPLALAGNEKVFQTGRASVQGFTAVFALFIVPKVDKIEFNLDDSADNVRAFVTEKLG